LATQTDVIGQDDDEHDRWQYRKRVFAEIVPECPGNHGKGKAGGKDYQSVFHVMAAFGRLSGALEFKEARLSAY
jgi:hypothetical protein